MVRQSSSTAASARKAMSTSPTTHSPASAFLRVGCGKRPLIPQIVADEHSASKLKHLTERGDNQASRQSLTALARASGL